MASQSPRDTPWTEHEKVILIAEIFRVLRIPPESLLRVLQEYGHREPPWNDMALPPGRSLNSCIRAFGEILNPPSSSSIRTTAIYPAPRITPAPTQGPITQQYHLHPAAETRKRPHAAIEPTSGPSPISPAFQGGRQLQPRPTGVRPHSIAGMPGGGGGQAYGASGGGGIPSQAEGLTGEQQKKKRGRPSKADLAARKEEAERRGETYVGAPAKKRKSGDELATEGQSGPSSAMTPYTPGAESAGFGYGASANTPRSLGEDILRQSTASAPPEVLQPTLAPGARVTPPPPAGDTISEGSGGTGRRRRGRPARIQGESNIRELLVNEDAPGSPTRAMVKREDRASRPPTSMSYEPPHPAPVSVPMNPAAAAATAAFGRAGHAGQQQHPPVQQQQPHQPYPPQYAAARRTNYRPEDL